MSSLSMCRLFRDVCKVEFHISDIIQPCVYTMKCLLQIFYQWNCACVLLHHNKINLLVIKQCLSESLCSLLSVIYPGSMKLPLSKTVLCAQKKNTHPWIILYCSIYYLDLTCVCDYILFFITVVWIHSIDNGSKKWPLRCYCFVAKTWCEYPPYWWGQCIDVSSTLYFFNVCKMNNRSLALMM